MNRRGAKAQSEIMAMIKQAASELAALEPVIYPDPMEPPWRVIPDYDMMSMGWRMGGGEDYMIAFAAWFKALGQARRVAFISANPEPEGWVGFYDRPSLDPQPGSPSS